MGTGGEIYIRSISVSPVGATQIMRRFSWCMCLGQRRTQLKIDAQHLSEVKHRSQRSIYLVSDPLSFGDNKNATEFFEERLHGVRQLVGHF
jgi:hypothetical protein